ncbi:MAG: hypothetical protein IJF18_05655 [Oscillospiraceae bacterium]|nr:hypothetical protein [Oscillospiraceae bacterium]
MSTHTFFLGGSSPDGFRTHFGDIVNDTDFHTYIIKGGPGTGKSTLMKKIAAAFDGDKEVYLCSSDPSSYDAVVLKERKAVILDGTSPHVFEPEYAGAVQEILNLGQCWDSGKLERQKGEIIVAHRNYSLHHLRCRRYLSAASSVIGDTLAITEAALDIPKLEAFSQRLLKKLVPHKKDGEGRLSYKQISAVTPEGYRTILPENDTVYLLNDVNMAATDSFLRKFSELLRNKGYDTEISECLLMKDSFFEHMRVPEAGISFISANRLNGVTVENKKPLNFARFYKKEVLTAKKTRLKFNSSVSAELTEEAVKCLVSAKTAHDKLEEYYIGAVDFKKADKICKELTQKIKS